MKEFLERILMSVPDVILVLDQDSRVEFVNSAFGRLMKKRSRDFLGLKLEDLGQGLGNEWKLLNKELEVQKKRGFKNDFKEKRKMAARSKEPADPLVPALPDFSIDPPSIFTFGERIFTYQFFDAGDEEENICNIGLLLSELVAEKQLLDQLTQAENLSGFTTFAAGMAHEINNPIFSILGHAEAILDEKDLEKIKGYSSKIRDKAKHISTIISNLSGFSTQHEEDFNEELDLNDIVEIAVKTAMIPFKESDVILEKSLAELPPFKGVSFELQNLFVSIVQNSLQAIEGKGKLSIKSGQSQDNILVQIQDSGPGIPQEFLTKIFNPFFTTKAQGEGTGLGLNVAQRIARKYRGNIEIKSEAGKGTEVTISLSKKYCS